MFSPLCDCMIVCKLKLKMMRSRTFVWVEFAAVAFSHDDFMAFKAEHNSLEITMMRSIIWMKPICYGGGPSQVIMIMLRNFTKFSRTEKHHTDKCRNNRERNAFQFLVMLTHESMLKVCSFFFDFVCLDSITKVLFISCCWGWSCCGEGMWKKGKEFHLIMANET